MNQLKSKPLTDAELVRQVLDGDADAFAPLLNKYRDHVFKVVKKHVPFEHTDETAQDVFVRAYRSLSGFKKANSFKQWLSAIAVRTCYDFWRKRYRSKEIPLSTLSEGHRSWIDRAISQDSERNWQKQGRQQEARDVLDWALSKLSPEDRMAMELIYLEGLSGKEAAELLGWSVANVKVRTFRCRKKLRKLLLTTGEINENENAQAR